MNALSDRFSFRSAIPHPSRILKPANSAILVNNLLSQFIMITLKIVMEKSSTISRIFPSSHNPFSHSSNIIKMPHIGKYLEAVMTQTIQVSIVTTLSSLMMDWQTASVRAVKWITFQTTNGSSTYAKKNVWHRDVICLNLRFKLQATIKQTPNDIKWNILISALCRRSNMLFMRWTSLDPLVL